MQQELMRGVIWSFIGKPFESLSAFIEEVKKVQLKFRESDSWEPDEVILEEPVIKIRYNFWKGKNKSEPVIELKSDNGRNFAAGELLFKIHNAVAEEVDDVEHHVFDGLSFVDREESIPVYWLNQG